MTQARRTGPALERMSCLTSSVFPRARCSEASICLIAFSGKRPSVFVAAASHAAVLICPLNRKGLKGENGQRIHEELQGGWLVSGLRILRRINQAILVLFLHLDIKRHQLCGIMCKAC